jgi:hypothetical protein
LTEYAWKSTHKYVWLVRAWKHHDLYSLSNTYKSFTVRHITYLYVLTRTYTCMYVRACRYGTVRMHQLAAMLFLSGVCRQREKERKGWAIIRYTALSFTHTHTHTHTHIHIHTHPHIHTYTHTHIHTYKHTHTFTYTHKNALTLPHSLTHSLIQTFSLYLLFTHTPSPPPSFIHILYLTGEGLRISIHASVRRVRASSVLFGSPKKRSRPRFKNHRRH